MSRVCTCTAEALATLWTRFCVNVYERESIRLKIVFKQWGMSCVDCHTCLSGILSEDATICLTPYTIGFLHISFFSWNFIIISFCLQFWAFFFASSLLTFLLMHLFNLPVPFFFSFFACLYHGNSTAGTRHIHHVAKRLDYSSAPNLHVQSQFSKRQLLTRLALNTNTNSCTIKISGADEQPEYVMMRLSIP